MFNKWQRLIQRTRSIVMRKIKERAGQQGWLNVAFELHICPLPLLLQLPGGSLNSESGQVGTNT